jgi:hypothetical protein
MNNNLNKSGINAECTSTGSRLRQSYLLSYWYGMVSGMVPLLPPGPQSLRPGGGSWIGRGLSMLRLSPFRPRLFGDGFRFHSDRRQRERYL